MGNKKRRTGIIESQFNVSFSLNWSIVLFSLDQNCVLKVLLHKKEKKKKQNLIKRFAPEEGYDVV